MTAIRNLRQLSWSLLFVACGQSAAHDDTAATPTCAATDSEKHACGTKGDLTGSTLIRETWSNNPTPELVGQPLTDGRYLQTARTLYCKEQYDPPPALAQAQSVLEVSGCVMKLNMALTPGDASSDVLTISVQSISYSDDGKIKLTRECPGVRQVNAAVAYGFDGSKLQMLNGAKAVNSTGIAYDCQYIDTWEME